MTKSTVYIKDDASHITVEDMEEGILYQVDDSETSWDLDIVTKSGGRLINLSCLTYCPKSVGSCWHVSVRRLSQGSSITLTQE